MSETTVDPTAATAQNDGGEGDPSNEPTPTGEPGTEPGKTGDGTNSGEPNGDDDALGDKGKKALDAMKAKEKATRAEARKLREELDALKAQLASQGKSEEERAAEEARRNAESEALSKANERILKSEVRAAAAGKLANPKDALAFLDLSQFEVDANGDVDAEEISDAITALLSERPYLAAQGGRAPQFDSGRGKSRPSQLTQADLKGMSPEQIEAARKAGRLDHLLGKK